MATAIVISLKLEMLQSDPILNLLLRFQSVEPIYQFQFLKFIYRCTVQHS